MENLIEEATRGNVTEVKVVLATVVLALAAYQLLLAATAYGWVRLPFLGGETASWTHRASGDAIVVLAVLVAVACLSFYGFEEGGAHTAFGCALLAVLAIKVAAVRRGGRLSALLPALGATVFVLFALTWLTSAGDFLGVSG